MAQQIMDVEPMQPMVPDGQGSSGDARATRRQLRAQLSSSASSEYGPITMSDTSGGIAVRRNPSWRAHAVSESRAKHATVHGIW